MGSNPHIIYQIRIGIGIQGMPIRIRPIRIGVNSNSKHV
jgi:hypothetical protein